MKIKNFRDIVAGGLIFALGVFFIEQSTHYSYGSGVRIGPGVFPLTLGIASVLISILILLSAHGTATRFPTIAWRPLICISAALVAFIILLNTFGMVPAVFVTVLVAMLAERTPTMGEALAFPAAVTLVSWVLFVVLLGVRVSVFEVPW